MIVKVGKDGFGAQMKANFIAQGISEEHILETDEASSGVAPIAVESSGFVSNNSPKLASFCTLLVRVLTLNFLLLYRANSIVIIPGANDLLSPEEVRAHQSAFTGAKYVLIRKTWPFCVEK